jgi:hypothetical protein
MYLGIQPAMDAELALSRDYYTLAIDIFKCLNLSRENRTEEPRSYLDKKYSDYKSLKETSSLLKSRLSVDLLATIPDGYENKSDMSNKPKHTSLGSPNPLQEEITFGDVL